MQAPFLGKFWNKYGLHIIWTRVSKASADCQTHELHWAIDYQVIRLMTAMPPGKWARDIRPGRSGMLPSSWGCGSVWTWLSSSCCYVGIIICLSIRWRLWPGASQAAHGIVHGRFMENMATIYNTIGVAAHRCQVCASHPWLFIIEKAKKRRTSEGNWPCRSGNTL